MSISKFIDNCVASNLSEKDMEFEVMRRFSKNTISRVGGMKWFRELYQHALKEKAKHLE